jgi:hypothetical protein
MQPMEHIEYLSKIGKRGGESTSKAKVKAAVKNAAKARKARTAKYPKCAGGYSNGSHRFGPDGRCYSSACRAKYPDLRRE